MVNYKRENLFRWRNFIRALLKFLPWQIAFHWEGWPVAPAKPTRMVLVGFGLAYLLVGIYLLTALTSKRNQTPYDWGTGSYVTKS